MENDSKSLSSVFIFKLCHFKAFDDYVVLHNLRMPLTHIVTLYHNTMKLLGMWQSFHTIGDCRKIIFYRKATFFCASFIYVNYASQAAVA